MISKINYRILAGHNLFSFILPISPESFSLVIAS